MINEAKQTLAPRHRRSSALTNRHKGLTKKAKKKKNKNYSNGNNNNSNENEIEVRKSEQPNECVDKLQRMDERANGRKLVLRTYELQVGLIDFTPE